MNLYWLPLKNLLVLRYHQNYFWFLLRLVLIRKDTEYKGNLSVKSKRFSTKIFRVLNLFYLLWTN